MRKRIFRGRSGGKRPKGRQREGWVDSIERDSETYVSVGEDEWRRTKEMGGGMLWKRSGPLMGRSAEDDEYCLHTSADLISYHLILFQISAYRCVFWLLIFVQIIGFHSGICLYESLLVSEYQLMCMHTYFLHG